MTAAKPAIEARQKALLEERYDLSNKPAGGVTMSRGKAVQGGVRAKLPDGRDLGRAGGHDAGRRFAKPATGRKAFLPLPHPNHAEGGMLFPEVPHRRDQEAGASAT